MDKIIRQNRGSDLMNEEQAIERCNELIKESHSCWIGMSNQNAIQTVLNILENQKAEIDRLKNIISNTSVQFINDTIKTDKKNKEDIESLNEGWKIELKKKDKIINLMAKELVKAHEWFYSEFDNYTKEDFIKYFEKKAEEE